MKTFYEYELNGKKIILHHTSIIDIQLGKNKSSYKTKHSFNAAEFSRAIMIYNGYNIGNGYKKRLICNTLNKRVIHRAVS